MRDTTEIGAMVYVPGIAPKTCPLRTTDGPMQYIAPGSTGGLWLSGSRRVRRSIRPSPQGPDVAWHPDAPAVPEPAQAALMSVREPFPMRKCARRRNQRWVGRHLFPSPDLSMLNSSGRSSLRRASRHSCDPWRPAPRRYGKSAMNS